MLLEGARHIGNPGFRGIFFRKTSPELRAGGGLWDTSHKIFGGLGGRSKEAALTWQFRSGAALKFSHLEHDKDRFAHQGAAYGLVAWDELTHFSSEVFWYLLSRNRWAGGPNPVQPYMRATCNPDPDSWVASFIAWWIDQETGLAIDERAGVLRYFGRIEGEIVWGDTPDEVAVRGVDPKDVLSATFIAARLEDNPALLEADPRYRAKLNALSYVDRKRLIEGNWKVREAAGLMFRREWFLLGEKAPPEAARVRYWDLASHDDKHADETAGVLLAMHSGKFWVEDVIAVKERPAQVEALLRRTAEVDGRRVPVWIEQEAVGSVGDYLLDHLRRDVLAGWQVQGASVRGAGTKVERAKPFSAAVEQGLVTVVKARWNQRFLDQAQNFPGDRKARDDMIDAAAGAFSRLTAAPALVWKSV